MSGSGLGDVSSTFLDDGQRYLLYIENSIRGEGRGFGDRVGVRVRVWVSGFSCQGLGQGLGQALGIGSGFRYQGLGVGVWVRGRSWTTGKGTFCT